MSLFKIIIIEFINLFSVFTIHCVVCMDHVEPHLVDCVTNIFCEMYRSQMFQSGNVLILFFLV